jgi:hypothetical protein
MKSKEECQFDPSPDADQILDMARSTVRQMTVSGDADHAVAFPSMGLPDGPDVDPMAAACDVGEDDTEVTFPDAVAVGEVELEVELEVEIEEGVAASAAAADLMPNPIQKVNN